MSTKQVTVAEKLEQLEAVLVWFESEEITVEGSLIKYEEALELSKEIEELLKNAKNKVEIIKNMFEA